MSDVQTLLSRCRDLGVEFTPTLHGTLKLKAPVPLPEPLREALKENIRPKSWPCFASSRNGRVLLVADRYDSNPFVRKKPYAVLDLHEVFNLGGYL